jgi:amino acid transporter
LIFISACILRIKEGDLPRPFRVPIGTKGFVAMCIPPIIIAFVALFINGTDYFVGGMIALVTGPIMYFIFKRSYGGLTKTDPVEHPANPRTGLAIGDMRRLTWMFGGLTAVGIIAVFFLPWYDDPQAYTDSYGIEGLFAILMSSIRWMTVAAGVLTLILGIIARRVEPKGAKASAPL